MTPVFRQIEAASVDLAGTPSIGAGSVVRGERVQIGEGAVIGAGVDIACDELILGPGARIGDGVTITAPRVELGEGTRIGVGSRVSLNEGLSLGAHSNLGARTQVAGQSMQAGPFLWSKDDVIIGGGGSAGPSSRLVCGEGVSIFDRSYVNLSEPVAIGDGSALSYDVVLLTHGAWQPALMGFATAFAPITIGANSVIYLRAVVMPGVTIGDYATIGACSLVLRDVPDRALAAGIPARILREGDYPAALDPAAQDALVRDVLRDYATTLAPKGLTARDEVDMADRVVVQAAAGATRIAYRGALDPRGDDEAAEITLGCRSVPEKNRGDCHLDLGNSTVDGELDPMGEDLRDYLRRRAIKLPTGRPFRALPLANLNRLARLRAEPWRRPSP